MIITVTIRKDRYSEPITVEEDICDHLHRCFRPKSRSHDFPGAVVESAVAREQDRQRSVLAGTIARSFSEILKRQILQIVYSQDPVNGYDRSKLVELGGEPRLADEPQFVSEYQNMPPAEQAYNPDDVVGGHVRGTWEERGRG